MAPRGRNINVFLVDGDPRGRIKCTLSNWTGLAYKIPRIELERCKERCELTQSGVYFLFGTDELSGENTQKVYIGQAGLRKNGEGILRRLFEQRLDKEFWNDAVVLTTSNNSFGQTEQSYLESRFIEMATEAGRFQVINENDPQRGNITEEKESELEEFIDNAKIVIGTLGYMVFERLLSVPIVVTPTESDSGQSTKVFQIKRSGVLAFAEATNEGIVVRMGSQIKTSMAQSCPKRTRMARESYKDFIDKDGVLQKNVLFHTASGASSFVLGCSTNGQIEWKTEGGNTYKDVMSSEGQPETANLGED